MENFEFKIRNKIDLFDSCPILFYNILAETEKEAEEFLKQRIKLTNYAEILRIKKTE